METPTISDLLVGRAVADPRLSAIVDECLSELGARTIDASAGQPLPPATVAVIAEFPSKSWEARVAAIDAGGPPLPHILLLRPGASDELVGLLRSADPVRRAVRSIIDRGSGLERRLAETLDSLLATLSSRHRFRSILKLLAGDDPALNQLVLTVLSDPLHHTTLARTLADVNASRKALERAIARLGFSPPSRYHWCVRAFGAHALLRSGATVERAATAMGYGSSDTLRGHFRALFALTPSEASCLSAYELAGRITRAA